MAGGWEEHVRGQKRKKGRSILFSNGCGVVVHTVSWGILVACRGNIQACCQVSNVGVVSKREEDGVRLQ